MYIRTYDRYDEAEMLALYESVGWTAYTKEPQVLRAGFEGSLFCLAAYEEDQLVGLLRAVGDGQTVVLLQDILVRPDRQRQGVGTKLVRAALDRCGTVRQVQLITDDRPETVAFYESLGFRSLEELGCKGFMRG